MMGNWMVIKPKPLLMLDGLVFCHWMTLKRILNSPPTLHHAAGCGERILDGQHAMGLDAHVACNCYELHRLRIQPPHPESVYIDEDGSMSCRDRAYLNEFDQWRQSACEHEWGWALHHYLGNIALIAFLRDELGNTSDAFPLILGKVIYNGIHSGDYIPFGELATLQSEVFNLAGMHSENQEDETFLRRFEQQMRELVACAFAMKKPIVF